MRQLSRLLLSGLVGLSLTVAATAAHASWSAAITDVMNLVYCLVGSGDCTGLQPGADTIDTTLDNVDDNVAAFQVGVAVLYEGGFNDGVASVDVGAAKEASYATGYDAGVASVDITTDNPACDWAVGEVWDGDECTSGGSSTSCTDLSQYLISYADCELVGVVVETSPTWDVCWTGVYVGLCDQ